MKPALQFLSPRSAVIYAHTRRMLNTTAQCVRKFALQVAENYVASMAPDQRQVPFKMGVTLDDLIKAEKHNGQIINRYMDGTVKALPADLEDAWITALPEPFRSDCERDLADRRGIYAQKKLEQSEQGEAVGLAGLAKEFGELVEALAPALADGKISRADLPYVRNILKQGTDLISAVLSMQRELTELLPGEGKANA